MLIGCADNDMPIKIKKKNHLSQMKENPPLPPNENTEVALFNILNLNYPGLATVKALHEAGDDTTVL